MAGFDDRKKGWEHKLQNDSEFRFKVAARRNKLLGRWAAEQMGLSGDDVEAYIKEVVKADFEEAGDEDVIRKLKRDFEARGTGIDESAIRTKLDEMNAAAAKELMEQ